MRGHGERRWKKLHLGVDRSGVIVAQALTDAHVDDATTAVDLIPVVDGDISRVTADAAYDTIAVYEAAGARGAQVVVPPKRTAAVSRRRPRSLARDRTVKRVQEIGRRRWKKETGYHRQARVENVFFRYKSIIGEGFRARSSAGQRPVRPNEIVVAPQELDVPAELVCATSVAGRAPAQVRRPLTNREVEALDERRVQGLGILRRQQRGVQPARRADLHAPLDPNDTIVPPRLEHLPIDAR